MIKIITAINNPNLNQELKKENNIEVVCKDIQYKEGILELLENNIEINYIIIDEKLPGEIDLNKLIEKIIEQNKKIKIIITIKKEDKNRINLNNKKIIKIFYEKNITLNKLKSYNSYENLSEENIFKNNKKNKFLNKKNNNSKIINFFGEPQVGKSLTIFNISNFLSNQNYKILIIELNLKNSCFETIFKSEIKNQKIKFKNKKLKKKIKNKLNNKKYKLKYLNEKIVNKFIIKINKNIDVFFYNKIINFNLIKKLENFYNYIFIENHQTDKKIKNNLENNILIIKPNLLGIKNSKKIIQKNKLNNNFKILINNYNKNSIDEEIIKNIFKENKIIGKINYEIEYEKIINTNFKNISFLSKEYKNNINKIVSNII